MKMITRTILSILAVAATYALLYQVAYEERGYFALGGEVLVALVVGGVVLLYRKEQAE